MNRRRRFFLRDVHAAKAVAFMEKGWEAGVRCIIGIVCRSTVFDQVFATGGPRDCGECGKNVSPPRSDSRGRHSRLCRADGRRRRRDGAGPQGAPGGAPADDRRAWRACDRPRRRRHPRRVPERRRRARGGHRDAGGDGRAEHRRAGRAPDAVPHRHQPRRHRPRRDAYLRRRHQYRGAAAGARRTGRHLHLREGLRRGARPHRRGVQRPRRTDAQEHRAAGAGLSGDPEPADAASGTPVRARRCPIGHRSPCCRSTT